MSKAIQGAAELAGAVAIGATMFALASTGVGFAAMPFLADAMFGLATMGIGMEAGAIADALTSNRGMSITTRQPASPRQIVYGTQRVGGVIVYQSTTGGDKDQYNFVIVLAGHVCSGITGLYLDGRKVYFNTGSGTTTGPDGVTVFGGSADGTTRVGPGGQNYNFGGAVYCEAYYGNQTSAPNTTPGGGYSTGLYANDHNWAPSGGRTPYLGGCTYVYLKIEYNTTLFPQLPEIKFTLKGKPVFDPRTGLTAYSENWALIANDILTDPVLGIGDPRVNQAQLIAAANVCDEAVYVQAIGSNEARYTCHKHYDTSTAPSDALSSMMNVAAGRISDIGGEYYLWPAYWQVPSFSFDTNSLTGPLKWTPNRSSRELFNRVTGTYTAPNYPYSVAGDLYDRNGWYDGTIANTFPYAFQPTNFPQYAADPAHGYAADEYLIADSGSLGAWSSTDTYNLGDVCTAGGGIWKSLVDDNLNHDPTTDTEHEFWIPYSNPLPKEVGLTDCLSLTQAQRVAKIMLLRNRQQGSGSTEMTLNAASMQPVDVMEFSFDTFGWGGKVLEITGAKPFRIAEDGNGVPSVRFGFDFQETDASVYAWNPATDEQTVYAVQPSSQGVVYNPAAPTGLSLVSSAATAVVGADGITLPRIQATWTTPADVLTTQIQVQYKLATDTGWTQGPFVDPSVNTAFIGGVVAGKTYSVRVRGLRSNGVASAWLEVDGCTVALTLSSVSYSGIAVAPSGTLGAVADSSGTATITIANFTASVNGVTASCIPSPTTLTGLPQGQVFYVYYVDPAFTGGTITPVATQNTADFIGVAGRFLIGSIVTPNYSTGGTGAVVWYPSAYVDTGTSTTSNPAAPYSLNNTEFAIVSGVWVPAAGGGGDPVLGAGICTWYDFPDTTPTGDTVYIKYSANSFGTGGSGVLAVSFDSGATWTTIASPTGAVAATTASVAIPSGTDLDSIQVQAQATPTGSGAAGNFAMKVSSIRVGA